MFIHGSVRRCPRQSRCRWQWRYKIDAFDTRAGRAGAVQQAGRGCLTSHGLPGQLGPGGQAREPPSELPETCRSTALPGAGPANILTLLHHIWAQLQMLPVSSSAASELLDLRIVMRRPSE